MLKLELISAKESKVCSIPSYNDVDPSVIRDLSSAWWDILHSLSSMLIPSISLLFRITMPKMPIQCCWYRIYIKQSPLWMWLHATFLDEQDELIKLFKNINDFVLYDNLHATHTGNYKSVSVLSCVVTWHITMRLYLCCQGFWMPTRSPLYPATLSWAFMDCCS